jgi:hypothetical protein
VAVGLNVAVAVAAGVAVGDVLVTTKVKASEVTEPALIRHQTCVPSATFQPDTVNVVLEVHASAILLFTPFVVPAANVEFR